MADGIPRITGLIRVAITWPTATPRVVANVLYVQGQRAFTSQGDADSIGGTVAPILASIMGLVTPPATPAPNFEAADYSPGGAYTGIGTVSSWTPGGSGAAAPSNVAALISWASAAPRYRGGHNRTYLGQLSDAILANDHQLTSDAVTDIGSAAVTMFNELSTIGSSLGGPYTLTAVHTSGALAGHTYPITGTVVQTMLATQRRRLRKVARHKKASA